MTAPSSVDEGSGFTFKVATTGVASGSVEGRVEAYTISGTGIDHIPVAQRSGTVVLDANGNASVSVDTLANLANSGTSSITIQVGNDSPINVTINETAQQTVTASAPDILEGGTVVFTIITSGVLGSAVAGQVETWTLSGAASDQINGPTSGSVVLDSNGAATVSVSTFVDALNDGPPQKLIFTLQSGNTTTAFTSTDVKQGTQTVTAPTTVDEGSAFTFKVTTTGVAPGSVDGRIETYTITGPGIEHIPVAERSGQLTLDATGSANITVHTLTNLGQTGSNAIFINVSNDPQVTVNIQETAFQTVTVNDNDINQGESVTFTIHTSGVVPASVAGMVQTWTLLGTATGASGGINQIGGPLSGTVTLDATGTATVTVDTTFSIINGPINPQNLTFRLNSGGTNVDSPVVTVHESTLSVSVQPPQPTVEGQPVTFTVHAGNIPFGTTFTYTLSGPAIGNVDPVLRTGTVTINAADTNVTIATISNDPSGLTKDLTFTIDQVPTATATAQIAETAPISFILTTGTDNFTGNPNGKNTFFATADSNPFFSSSTLGQNDNLNGGGTKDGPNTLFLTTKGSIIPVNINSFTTHNIQLFEINAGNTSVPGTRIDMSSAFGFETITDRNSSGTLQLLNLQNPIVLNIFDPSDLGFRTDVGLQYVAGQLPFVNAGAGQIINLDPTVSPITGMPNTAVNAPGVTTFTINSNNATNPNNSIGFNGLVSLNQPLPAGFPFNTANPLFTVNMQGTVGFVLGGLNSGVPGMAFTGFFSTLNLTNLQNTFFTVGDPGAPTPAITFSGGGTLTINGGPGANGGPSMQAWYGNPFGLAGPQNGGNGGSPTILSTSGSLQLNVASGDFIGQHVKVNSFGSSVFVTGVGPSPTGGFVDDVINAATIQTNNGFVQVSNLDGGLGTVRAPSFPPNPNSFIMTNTSFIDGGNVLITDVNGGINVQISTGAARAQILETGNTGDMIVDFSHSLLPGIGNNSGFHGGTPATRDEFFGGTGVNTLIFDPVINNNTNGEGVASNLKNLILQNDTPFPLNVWGPGQGANAGSPINPLFSVGLAQLGNNVAKPIDVYIGGIGNTANLAFPINATGLAIADATFTGAVNNERFFIDTFSTGQINGDVFSFDFGGTSNNTLNLILQNIVGNGTPHSLTVRDFAVGNAAGNNAVVNNPVSRLNFTATANTITGAATTLTIDTMQRLTTLFLIGTANMVVNDTATQAKIINHIDGQQNNSNIDLRGLMTAASTAGAGYVNPGKGAADALSATTTPANPGIIHLGNGANKIAVGAGSWNITSNGTGTTVLVNPISGDLDNIVATGGLVTVTVGAVGGGGGQVSITTNNGGNRYLFDQSALPQLNSSVVINAGNGAFGNDKIQILNGGLIFFDAGFSQVTGVEQLQLETGFSNRLQLNFNADNNAATNQTGMFEVISGGGGLITSSTFLNAGAGYNHPLLFTVGAQPGGDGGGDHVQTNKSVFPGSNPLTVQGTATDILVSFEAAALTIQGDSEGIFATTTANNEVKLLADNTVIPLFGTGAFGINGVQTFTGVDTFLNSLGVVLLNDGVAAGSPEVVNFSAITGSTYIDASLLSKAVSIDGGQGNVFFSTTNTLIGGKGNDQLRGHGTDNAPFTNQTVFFGGLGADQITLSTDGGAGIGSADVVAYNSHFESTVGSTDLVENFHGGPGGDTFFFNPAEFVFPTLVFVGPNGGANSYADALTFLNPLNLNTQAVLINTGGSTGQLWVDVDHDQNLNAADYVINMTFASPPFLTGANFPQLAPATISFPAYGPLPLTPPAPAQGILPTMTTTLAAWNLALPPTVTDTLNFVGAGGTATRKLTPIFENYNFSALLSGVTAETENFTGGPVFVGTSSITGSAFDDVLKATAFDILAVANGLAIDLGGGDLDKLVLRSGGTQKVELGATSGSFNPVVNTEVLDIDNEGTAMEISFATGGAFKFVNGGATNTVGNTINTENLVPGGVIDLSKDKGADIVNLDDGYGSNKTVSTIRLNGLGTVNMNFSGVLNPLTTTIVGLLNLDKLVLNDGDNEYHLDQASITDVTTLDMTQADDDGVFVNSAQIGGLNGFTEILIATGGGDTPDLHIVNALPPPGSAVAADFTNVKLNTTDFELHVGLNNTVKLLTTQVPQQGIDGTGATNSLIFIDDGATIDLRGTTYNDLGSITWQDDLLLIDNTAIAGGSPHGITELHGNGSSAIYLDDGGGSPTDLSNIVAWDGVLTVFAGMDDGDTLRMAAYQLEAMNILGGARIIATGGLGEGDELNLVIDAAADYDISTPLAGGATQLELTDTLGNDWDSIDFNGDNVANITAKVTDLFVDNVASDVDTLLGDAAGTTNLEIYLSNISTNITLSDITTFSGFKNVSVIDPFTGGGSRLFEVRDNMAQNVLGNGGAATLDLNNNSGNIASLWTSAASNPGPNALNGIDNHWDILGFNAGSNPLGSVLQIVDNGGAPSVLTGEKFISVFGTTMASGDMNIISGALAPVTDLFDLTDGGTVETAIAVIAGLVSSGAGQAGPAGAVRAYFTLYGAGPDTGKAGVYMMVFDNVGAGDLTAGTPFAGHFNDFTMNLIGVIDSVASNSLHPDNFFG
ncbi:MAG: hypothetical protein U1E21_07305 [Reyranellaceae bacterium]